MRRVKLLSFAGLFVATLGCGGSGGIGAVGCSAGGPAPDMATGPAVDPTTAAAITASVKFEGPVPAPTMIRIDGDPKCVAENGGKTEQITIGPKESKDVSFTFSR